MTLLLPEAARDGIVAHAREGAPEEVVGVLAGDRGADRSVVARTLRADNAADTPGTRYEIAPGEELELLERVDEAGQEVVGFYHSHPDGPLAPSAVDARRAAWRGYSYLIVSLADAEPEVGSWRWTGEAFRAERVALR
jgi:proteasome lid subunit RPN8/RPN11